MGKTNKHSARWLLMTLAMVVFDIVAVNLSYFGALIIRFYVASRFSKVAWSYLPAFTAFAPYYTVASLVIFYLFKLYNNRWKYAGLNDLNRIIFANLTTCLIQIIGTCIFFKRMPITYYIIGALLQFALILASRFAYRFLAIERTKMQNMRNKAGINVMVVGVGDTSHNLIRHLENNADSAAHPVCIVDFRGNEFGDRIEGIPVIRGIDQIEENAKKYNVGSIIIADPLMPQDVKKQIRLACAKLDVEILNFSGYMQNYRGNVSLRSLMEYTMGSVELVVDGKSKVFINGEQAMQNTNGQYVVSAISAKGDRLVVELKKDVLVRNNVKQEWVQAYEKETGADISFF